MNDRADVPANETVRLDQLCIDTLRTLSIDAVQQANSGHPGTPMGVAPIACCLWQRFLCYDPNDPEWPDRDRFVLPAGHLKLARLCWVYDANRISIEGSTAITFTEDVGARASRSRPRRRWGESGMSAVAAAREQIARHARKA